MTDEEHTYWHDYLRSLADGLGLRDWRIDLMRDPPEDAGDGTSMLCYYQRKIVRIRLNAQFAAYSPEEQRHFCLHELVHVHLDEVDSTLNDAEQIIGGDGFKMMAATIKQRMEFATDAIAEAFAPFYALPPERTP